MTDKKVWFVTGAGRGMGVDIAQAALAAGYAVVATGRNTEAVADAYRDLSSSLAIDELEREAEHSPGTTVMDPERRHLETSRSRGRARVSPGRSTRFWAGGEQLPVSLGDDFDVAVDHSYRGLVVDRVRRHR